MLSPVCIQQLRAPFECCPLLERLRYCAKLPGGVADPGHQLQFHRQDLAGFSGAQVVDGLIRLLAVKRRRYTQT